MATRMRKPRVVDLRGRVRTHGIQKPHGIVLHSTEGNGTGEQVADFWAGQGQQLGAHFHVSRTGRICQYAASDKVCWAVFGHNTGYIHVELQGFAAWSKLRWLASPLQILALARLLAYLTWRWGIYMRYGKEHGICRHLDFRDVPASMYHHDPGEGFPLDGVIRQTRLQRKLGW